MNEDKKLQIIYEGLKEIEQENKDKKSYPKTNFIFLTKSMVNYRKVMPPDVCEDGSEVKCARCGNVMELLDCKWTDFEFCPLCGQRWQREGSRKNKVLYG